MLNVYVMYTLILKNKTSQFTYRFYNNFIIYLLYHKIRKHKLLKHQQLAIVYLYSFHLTDIILFDVSTEHSTNLFTLL